jgi:hypothetical protein
MRFLAALAGTGVVASVATACGGSTDDDGSGGTSSGGTSSGGSGAVSSGGSGGATGGAAGMGGASGSGGSPPACEYGTPSQECFTLDQLESMINNPFRGGDVGLDAGADAWIEVTECLPKESVQDGCCNQATYGPEKQGEECCYVFCTGGCCGRPLVVGGEVRLPDAVTRRDWLGPLSDDEPAQLDAVTREALATAWLDDARMEHASIASFSRFTLELLAFGAPPDLVADAQHATLDEVNHARSCFALASRFAERALGPGPLDASGPLSSSLADAAAAAFEEGCVGETLAALSAREQHDAAGDFQVRRTLAEIADDEERHAELAWRFVAWALKVGGPAVHGALSNKLSELLSAPQATAALDRPAGVDPSAWRRYGRLAQSEAARLRQTALSEVIAPCARALLAVPTAAEAPRAQT